MGTHEDVEGLIPIAIDTRIASPEFVQVCAVLLCDSIPAKGWWGPEKPPAAVGGSPSTAALAYHEGGDGRIWEGNTFPAEGGFLYVAIQHRRHIALAKGLARGIGTCERLIRFHNRVPVVSPESGITRRFFFSAALIEGKRGKGGWVGGTRQPSREATGAIGAVSLRFVLLTARIPLSLSQDVFAAGGVKVNDDPEFFTELMRALFECRVKPYLPQFTGRNQGA